MWKTKMDRTEFYQYLDRIIGKPVSCIGRAANMVWIGIGKNIMTVDWKGREKEKNEYALHIQSPWRIINKKQEEIVMTSSDMYSSRTGMVYSEDFNWEPQGNNLFDEKLQVFNVASDDTESWRLLMPGSKEMHLVVSGIDIYFG